MQQKLEAKTKRFVNFDQAMAIAEEGNRRVEQYLV